jgi:hypothetical protein
MYLTRCNITRFILSGNCSTCFGWYHHPSSGAQTTVSTASVTPLRVWQIPDIRIFLQCTDQWTLNITVTLVVISDQLLCKFHSTDDSFHDFLRVIILDLALGQYSTAFLWPMSTLSVISSLLIMQYSRIRWFISFWKAKYKQSMGSQNP